MVLEGVCIVWEELESTESDQLILIRNVLSPSLNKEITHIFYSEFHGVSVFLLFNFKSGMTEKIYE